MASPAGAVHAPARTVGTIAVMVPRALLRVPCSKRTWVRTLLVVGVCFPAWLPAQRLVRESLAEWRAAPLLPITATQRWCADSNAPGCELRTMLEVFALPDGGIVASEAAGPIHRFDRSGTFVGTLGRKGRGPGEYGFVIAPQLLSSGHIAWFDITQMRVTTIGLDGTPGPSQPLTPPRTMTAMYLVDGQLVVLEVPPAPGAVGDTVTGAYRTVPPSGASWVLARARTPSVFAPGSDMMMPPPPFAPTVVASVGWAGDVAHANGGEYVVEVFPSVGNGWRLVVAAPTRPVSSAERDSVVRETLARGRVASVAALPAWQRARLDNASRTMPPLQAIRVLRDGTIWILPTPAPGARSARWDVFSRDGRRIGAVVLPATARVRDGTRDWVLVVEKGRDDVPIAVRYTVGR